MKSKVLDTLYVFSREDLYEAYDKIVLPEDIVLNGTNQFKEDNFDLFIGDVESFVKCLSWMGQKNCVPDKIILLRDNFKPISHIKKETIIIPSLDSLGDKEFWEEFFYGQADNGTQNL